MCGIAGWVAPQSPSLNTETLARMLGAIAHRGPDGEGMHVASPTMGGYQAFLGHRRLAIIDPLGAQQPMRDDKAGLSLIFNGEIYNFRELRSELEKYGHC